MNDSREEKPLLLTPSKLNRSLPTLKYTGIIKCLLKEGFFYDAISTQQKGTCALCNVTELLLTYYVINCVSGFSDGKIYFGLNFGQIQN